MANMNIMPGGGSGRDQEPIQNWWAHDNPMNVQPQADPLARNRSMFGAPKGNPMQGTQPVGGRAPESSYYSTQPVYPAAPNGTIRGAPTALPNSTGFNSGQFRNLQMRQNPFGGGGYGFGGQMQMYNPNVQMRQLQQWRNPYVNNMLSQGYMQQPQMGNYYNRPQMQQAPQAPQLPQFAQWNPYYGGAGGMMPGTQPVKK